MKKKFAILLGIVLVLALAMFVHDLLLDSLLPPELNQEEIALLEDRMEAYDCHGEQFHAEVLYNPQGRAAYLFATSERGYIIYDRLHKKTKVMGSHNPYDEYMSYKKYYDGTVLFYVEMDGRFYDFHRQKFFD